MAEEAKTIKTELPNTPRKFRMGRLESNENKTNEGKNGISSILKPYIVIPAITIAIFLLTKLPAISLFKLQLTVLSFFVFVVYSYFLKKKGVPRIADKRFIYLLVTVVLFLVASTGWFFSPFFFVLYLLAIFLAFIFSSSVSIAFVGVLVALFSFNIGEVDLAYDFMIVLSLLTTIPLSLYLRKEYLKLKENEKEILVLQKQKENFNNKIEEVLANTVNNFSVNLRQPINDIKQLAYRMEDVKDKKEIDKNRERIAASSEEALRLLKEFEEQSTGKRLLSNPDSM